jgi:hypothetical protein
VRCQKIGITVMESSLFIFYYFFIIWGQAIERFQSVICSRSPSNVAEAAKIGTEEEGALFDAKEELLSTAKLRVSANANTLVKEPQSLLTSKSDEVNVTTRAGMVSNYCCKSGHFACKCRRKRLCAFFIENET